MVSFTFLSRIRAVLFGSSFSGGDYGALAVLAILAVGIPVSLWLRFRLLTPLVLAGLVIAFWQVLVSLLGNEGDGTPVFALALAMTPLYVIGYSVLSVIEIVIKWSL